MNRNMPYFDNDCKNLKKSYYRCLNIYRNYTCDENRVAMVKARSEYKNTVRKKKFIYDKDQSKKLENARFSNAKSYWKMLRGSVVNKDCNCTLSANDFQQYFKAINDPDSCFYQPDEDVLYFNKRYLDGELNVMFSELNIPFSNQEIIKTCKTQILVNQQVQIIY